MGEAIGIPHVESGPLGYAARTTPGSSLRSWVASPSEPRSPGGNTDGRPGRSGGPAPCWAVDLGTFQYGRAWNLQGELVRARLAERVPDLLLFVQHPHVYTLGRGGDDRHVLWDERRLAQRGVEIYHVDRGGDVTYHGPGQAVGYPIIALRRHGLDAHKYLRDLEEVLVPRFGRIRHRRRPRSRHDRGLGGQRQEIAAIGVKFTRWADQPRVRPQRQHGSELLRRHHSVRLEQPQRHFYAGTFGQARRDGGRARGAPAAVRGRVPLGHAAAVRRRARAVAGRRRRRAGNPGSADGGVGRYARAGAERCAASE